MIFGFETVRDYAQAMLVAAFPLVKRPDGSRFILDREATHWPPHRRRGTPARHPAGVKPPAGTIHAAMRQGGKRVTVKHPERYLHSHAANRLVLKHLLAA